MLSKLISLMVVSLTCGEPPHLTFNRLPLSLFRRQTHFSGQSLWLLSTFSVNTKHKLAHTNNKMSKQLLGIMSNTPNIHGTHSIHIEWLLWKNLFVNGISISAQAHIHPKSMNPMYYRKWKSKGTKNKTIIATSNYTKNCQFVCFVCLTTLSEFVFLAPLHSIQITDANSITVCNHLEFIDIYIQIDLLGYFSTFYAVSLTLFLHSIAREFTRNNE